MLDLQVEEYIDVASRKSDLERTELQKEKTGIFSGSYARNPANGEAIPIWVADYVLGRYLSLILVYLNSIMFFSLFLLVADMCFLSGAVMGLGQ